MHMQVLGLICGFANYISGGGNNGHVGESFTEGVHVP